jgi:hypothetical protein
VNVPFEGFECGEGPHVPAFFLYLFNPTDVAQRRSACFFRREPAVDVPSRLMLDVILQFVIQICFKLGTSKQRVYA